MSWLAKKLISECLSLQNPYLDLGNCGLTDLTKIPQLFECIHLETLILSNNWSEERFSELTESDNSFYYDNDDFLVRNAENLNFFQNIPPQIEKLKKLKKIIFAGSNSREWGIKDVSFLNTLQNLESLDLSFNKIDNFSNINLNENVRKIILTKNKITEFSLASKLEKLFYLDIGLNKLKDIRFLIKTSNIEKLFLDYNEIEDISVLAKLKKIKEISLSGNRNINSETLLKCDWYYDNQVAYFFDNLGNKYLQKALNNGPSFLKNYFETLVIEGQVLNDNLKVIILGNCTVGKTSLVNYWLYRDFNEKQLSTHGISALNQILKDGDSEDRTFKINVWDFGGQDYFHATHRLFINRESTFILVCVKQLEHDNIEETITEPITIDGVASTIDVSVRHYPYRYWLQTIVHLIKAIEIPKEKQPKLFLVENKSASRLGRRMRLKEKELDTIPLELANTGEFYELDVKQAWRYTHFDENSILNIKFDTNYQLFEQDLIDSLKEQIENSRYEVHANYPVIRDILNAMAKHSTNKPLSDELTQLLVEGKIEPIHNYRKLPFWITLSEFEYLVRKNSKSDNPHWESLNIYLQNLCGSILHFKDVPSLNDIVFIDPNWLHQTIYKVLNKQILSNKGEFKLEDVDHLIDKNVIQASVFLDVMKELEIIFEIPNQEPAKFIAPQYLPASPPDFLEAFTADYQLGLSLIFENYLPPTLILRIICEKGGYIGGKKYVLWRNGLSYNEQGIGILITAIPETKTIKLYFSGYDKSKLSSWGILEYQTIMRNFMILLEKKFTEDIDEMLVQLPNTSGIPKWKHMLRSKKHGYQGVKDHSKIKEMVDTKPFEFLLPDFERKPVNIFVCYSHEDLVEKRRLMKDFEPALKGYLNKSNIIFNLFHDEEMPIGIDWLSSIRENMKKNDILICLLSNSFFNSTFIKREEFGKKVKEILHENEKTIIAPLYLKTCQIVDGEPILRFNFFKPSGKDFNITTDENHFSFSTLIDYGKPSDIEKYANVFLDKLKSSILEIWSNNQK